MSAAQNSCWESDIGCTPLLADLRELGLVVLPKLFIGDGALSKGAKFDNDA